MKKLPFWLILTGIAIAMPQCKKNGAPDSPHLYRGYVFDKSPLVDNSPENNIDIAPESYANCNSTSFKSNPAKSKIVCHIVFDDRMEVTLHFKDFSTAPDRDILFIEDEDNAIKTTYHGNLGNFWTEPITVKSITLRFVSNTRNPDFKFTLDKISAHPIAPVLYSENIPVKEIEVTYESEHEINFSIIQGIKNTIKINKPGAKTIELHFSLISINRDCQQKTDTDGCPSSLKIFNEKQETAFSFSTETYMKNIWLKVNGDTAYIVYTTNPFKSARISRKPEIDYGFKIDRLKVHSHFPVYKYSTRYPIVFAHGLFGFSQLHGLEYFYKVKKHLEDQGYEVYMTEVPPVSSLQTRADYLADQIKYILKTSSVKNERKIDKIHFIAHSMGGLDGRVLISQNTRGYTRNPDKRFVIYGRDMGDKFASFVTIGTPHKGTIIADILQGFIPEYNIKKASVAVIQVMTKLYNYQNPDEKEIVAASFELTEKFCQQFNIDHPEPVNKGIHYMTFAGITRGPDQQSGNSDEVNILLMPTYFLLEKNPNPEMRVNDGIVPFESAKWKNKYYTLYRGHTLEADHLDEIGQILGQTNPNFNHLDFYDFIVSQLEKEIN